MRVSLAYPRALMVALLLAPEIARAQNLLTNADFDTGLQGWLLLTDGTSDPSAAAFWSPEDCRLRPLKPGPSGSAVLAAIASPVSTEAFGYLYQAGIPVSPGTYWVGGAITVDRSSAGGAEVRFGVNWSGSGPCFGGSIISTTLGPPIPEGSPWTMHVTALNAPAGASFACFFLYAQNGHRTVAARLDRAIFQLQ
jgi:hypothetical protein